MILEGRLGLQDEVCQANSYWIYVHDREEIRKQLNIEVPKSKNSEYLEEPTQTGGFSEVDDVTDPDVTQLRTRENPDPSRNTTSTVNPSSSIPALGALPGAYSRVEVKGQSEKLPLWKILAWGVVVCGSLILAWMRVKR